MRENRKKKEWDGRQSTKLRLCEVKRVSEGEDTCKTLNRKKEIQTKIHCTRIKDINDNTF